VLDHIFLVAIYYSPPRKWFLFTPLSVNLYYVPTSSGLPFTYFTHNMYSIAGSLLYLCTPVGSLMSSLVLGRLGHKKCMIITNIPYLVSQIMFFYAENVETMYACSIMMGLSVGFSGGPFSAYIGEVCEPKLRGTLMCATNVFYFGGSLLFVTIYAITRQWRLTVLINMAIPIITIAILCMVGIFIMLWGIRTCKILAVTYTLNSVKVF